MKIGRILGVRIKLNIFFLLILAIYGSAGYLTEALIIYGAALLHEIAHAVVAHSYGLKIDEIELLPFGGVARIRDLDLSSWDLGTEIMVTLAGPAENMILAATARILAGYGVWDTSLAGLFYRANIAIAGFNLLPALPLDGGRLLRAYLARHLSWHQATEITARLGQALGALLVSGGLVLLKHNLLFINVTVLGIFLWAAAAGEKRWAGLMLLRYLTRKHRGLKTGQIAKGELLAVSADTTLRELAQRFVAGRYHFIYILDKDYTIMAIISEDEVVTGLFTHGPNITLKQLLGCC
ncbi:MAG: hypothetical protein GX952_04310 [Firmicutes bacterium]|nr:hypothetical protein [Bacillota bacterium]